MSLLNENNKKDVKELLYLEPVPEEDRIYYLEPKDFDGFENHANYFGKMDSPFKKSR